MQKLKDKPGGISRGSDESLRVERTRAQHRSYSAQKRRRLM